MDNEAKGLQLTAAELEQLSQLVLELRYKDAAPFVQFFQDVRRRTSMQEIRERGLATGEVHAVDVPSSHTATANSQSLLGDDEPTRR